MVHVRKLTNKDYLNLYELEILRDLNKQIYHVASRRSEDKLAAITGNHDRCDAVIIIPMLDNGRIILIREFRPAINDYIYSFPAGLVDEGEIPMAAAIRELKEETNLNCLEISQLLQPSYSSAGISDETNAVFICSATGEASPINASENEDIQVTSISLNDVPEFISKQRVGMKTALLLMYLHAKLKSNAKEA